MAGDRYHTECVTAAEGGAWRGFIAARLFLAGLLLLLPACPPLLYMPEPKNPPAAAPAKSSAEQANYFTHTVRYTGETPSIIALWYTGSSGNSSLLLADNPGLTDRRIQIGDKVRIRPKLLVRSDPLPTAFILEETRKRIQQSTRQDDRISPADTAKSAKSHEDSPTDLASLPLRNNRVRNDEDKELRDKLLESFLEEER